MEYPVITDLAKRAFDWYLRYKRINLWICILFFLPSFWIWYSLENITWFFIEKQGETGFFLETVFFFISFFIFMIFLEPLGKIALLTACKQKEQKHISKIAKDVLQKVLDSVFTLFLAKATEAIVILIFLSILFFMPKGVLFWILFLPLCLFCIGVICYLETIWCFVLQSVVLEGKKGWQALQNSRDIVKGRFVQTAILFFGAELLQVAFYFLLSVIVSFLGLFFVFFSVFTNNIAVQTLSVFFKSITVTTYSMLFLTAYYCHMQKIDTKKIKKEFDILLFRQKR